jgi:molecular chaperone DnaJ
MNLTEAYSVLELQSGASPEEAKKKYHELTKKFHPDVNKDAGAEDKFKKINQAYECVKNGKGDDRDVSTAYGHSNSGWNPFIRQEKQVIQLEHVEVYLTIDFKDAVLGCKREIKYSRKSKCPECNGEGEIHLNNGCKKCNGKGSTTINRGGMIFVSTCPQCGGQSPTEDCKSCKAEGTAQADVSVHVNVPAGVIDGNVLRLQGMGNYAGSVMGVMDQYTDAFCHITVTPDLGLAIEGKCVVSNLSLPLLDAIRGCKRNVKTIFGTKEIQILPLSRHNDEVIIPHCGVGGTGDQRVLLNVQYPKNTDKLVDVLLDEVI